MRTLRRFLASPWNFPIVLALVVGCALLLPSLASGQTYTPDDTPDFGAMLALGVEALRAGRYAVLAGVGLSLVTWGVRAYVFPRWAWAQTDRGGVVLAFGVSLMSTVAAGLASGTASVATLGDALAALMLSAGAYSVFRKVVAPRTVLTPGDPSSTLRAP
jgi:hypothetical protein